MSQNKVSKRTVLKSIGVAGTVPLIAQSTAATGNSSRYVGISYEPQPSSKDNVIVSDAKVQATNDGLKGRFRIGNNVIPVQSNNAKRKSLNGESVSAVRDHTITAENGDFSQTAFLPSSVRMKVTEGNNLAGYIRDNNGKIMFNLIPEDDFGSAEAARNYLIRRVI